MKKLLVSTTLIIMLSGCSVHVNDDYCDYDDDCMCKFDHCRDVREDFESCEYLLNECRKG